MMNLQFGCLPRRLDLNVGEIAIATRADLDKTLAAIAQSGRVYDGWMYPTLPTKVSGGYDPYPYPEPRFVLPLTHELRHTGAAQIEQLRFLVNAVGFLLGCRLLPEGYGHLQRTPMRTGSATDLIVSATDLAACLLQTDATWGRLSANQRLALEAVITAYQTALAYRHQFEQFTFLYSAMDAIWHFHRVQKGLATRGGHADRPKWLCTDVLGIPVPDWAKAGPTNLAVRRNLLIHEALYGEAPLGQATPQAPLLDVKALVSRAIVKALGISCGYVSSPCTTQQMHGLDMI